MKKSLYALLFGTLLLGAFVLPAKALADCQAIYGGGQTCSNNFSIEKFVKTPGKGGGAFVSNLDKIDPRFSPAQIATFKIVVKNTGADQIPTLTLTDAFPQLLSFVSGPGSFDSNTKILTFTVNNLESGKSQEFIVTGKLAESNALPANEGIMCLINQASATDNNGMTNASTSRFCVEKTVLGTVFPAPNVIKTPPTGPEMLSLLALLPAGLAGFTLRKKSINK